MLLDPERIATICDVGEGRVRELLARAGAMLEGHFVGTSGKHLSLYVAKDRGTRLTSVASELCAGIAARFANADVDAVVSPAVGGVALSMWTAYHLTRFRSEQPEVLALYSEHEEKFIMASEKDEIRIPLPPGTFDRENEEDEIILKKGEKLVVVKPTFVLKRGFAEDVQGKRILVVEDILTTGGSARNTVEAVIAAGGVPVGCGVLANGGNVMAADLNVPRLEALMKVTREIYTEAECAAHGLCFRQVPVNTDFGHGTLFLARRQAAQAATT